MNFEELRSVQSKERSKDSLQHLRESFYAEAGEYIVELREERERAADRADNPLDSSEVNRLTDDIQTAESVVEAIYERRVGKVVKRASLAATGMPADEEGLTSEERELFDSLVEEIERNKAHVLDVLAGDADADGGDAAADDDAATDTATDDDAATDTATDPLGDHGVDAADVMGGFSSNSDSNDERPASAEAAAVTDAEPDATADADSSTPEAAAESDGDETGGESDALDDRTMVRITQDVGEIFGVDEREYDLSTEDVVTLPTANARPLIEREAAEELN